jgi:putative ABC transport system substrate-binding protein
MAYEMKSFVPQKASVAGIIVVLLLLFGIHITDVPADNARVVALTSHAAGPYWEVLKGFKQYFREQKMAVKFEIFSLDGDVALAERAVEEAGKGGADLFFTLGSIATEATISKYVKAPIVAGLVLEPGILEKADNATGVVMAYKAEKQFQWMRRFIPRLRTIGVIYNPDQNQKKIDAVARVAQRMKLRLDARRVFVPTDLPRALRELSKTADVLWGIPDRIVLTPETARTFLLFSFRNRIPFVGLSRSWVKAGALYALGWDYADLGTQCGEIAVKVLRGRRIQSIPTLRPRKVLHYLNLKTARHMKIEIPEVMIRSAKEIF